MIVFDLECRAEGHRFEGWFASGSAFRAQQDQGLLACPACGSGDVDKALSVPRLARKGNQLTVAPRARRDPALASGERASDAPAVGGEGTPAMAAELPPQAARVLAAMAQMQAALLQSSRWVGERFADDVRAMHYGEREAETVHGRASAEEASELLEEGIMIAPLPFPVAPPEDVN